MPAPESVTPYLEEHGPTPRPDLPVELTHLHRRHGVRAFQLTSGVGDTRRAGGQSIKIAYLPTHEKAAVCRQFFEANPEFVEAQTYKSVSRQLTNHGSEWVDACRSVLTEYFEKPTPHDSAGWEAGETDTCPMCGSDVPKGGLPSHLTDCSGD